MPAKSKVQQKAAGAALAAKRGDTAKSKLKGAAREMFESMTERELDEMASVKRRSLPERKSTGEPWPGGGTAGRPDGNGRG